LNDTNYFWLTGEFTDHEPENEKNDHWALVNGYVAHSSSGKRASHRKPHQQSDNTS